MTMCEAHTRPGPGGWWKSRGHRCTRPAKYRVIGNIDRHGGQSIPMEGEFVCGTHVRPALMDNGDSVWKPWIVTRLDG